MPGFIQNVCDTSYGYVDPYVQKMRNDVPYFNAAANVVEPRLKPLISKVDTLAEPAIEKIRPTVEPLVKKGVERVEPLVKKGVEEAEKLKELAMPYYEGGANRIEKAKALVTTLEKEGAKQVKDIQADVQQLYHHPSDVQQLYRVPASPDLQELKSVSKINMMLDKVETIIDKYLPAPPNNGDAQSDDSSASEKSAVLPRVISIPSTLACRLVFKAKTLIPKWEDLTVANLKAVVGKVKGKVVNKVCTIGTSINTKVQAKVALVYTKAKPFVEKKSEALNKTRIGKFMIGTACSTGTKANSICEKVLGKERMQAYLAKVQGYVKATAIAPAAAQQPPKSPNQGPQKKKDAKKQK